MNKQEDQTVTFCRVVLDDKLSIVLDWIIIFFVGNMLVPKGFCC